MPTFIFMLCLFSLLLLQGLCMDVCDKYSFSSYSSTFSYPRVAYSQVFSEGKSREVLPGVGR